MNESDELNGKPSLSDVPLAPPAPSSPPTPTIPPAPPGPPGYLRAIRGFIEGNYFYVISALLMMLGCYLLMASPRAPGPAFTRTLQGLLILQGYELLVIATAILIAKRFRRLGDGFTLLAIELALLLDPTFFSNAFITIPNAEVPPIPVFRVIGCCLLLVLLKLEVMQRLLRFRLTARGYAGFLVAAVLVYFASAPLNRTTGPIPRDLYALALSWAPFVLAALFPALGRILDRPPLPAPAGFMTPRQGVGLPRILFWFPLLIVAAHFLESLGVYGLHFHAAYGAGFLMALAWVVTRQAVRENAFNSLTGVDMLVFLAALVSFDFPRLVGPPPAAAVLSSLAMGGSRLSVAMAVAAIAVVYYYFWRRLSYRPALVRVAALLFAAAVYLLARAGVVSWGAQVAGSAISSVWAVVVSCARAIRGAVPPSAAAFIVGLLLFGLGVVVTFRKEALLGWFERRFHSS